MAQRFLWCLQLQTPDLVRTPNFLASGNLGSWLVPIFLDVEVLEMLEENDHMVGSWLGHQMGTNWGNIGGSSFRETEMG